MTICCLYQSWILTTDTSTCNNTGFFDFDCHKHHHPSKTGPNHSTHSSLLLYSCCFSELSKSAPAQLSGKKSAVTEPLLKTAAFDDDSDSDGSDSDNSSPAGDDQEEESRDAVTVRDGGKVIVIQPDMSQQHHSGNSNKSRSNKV